METTNNINLNKPARGDFNWDKALNGNFDIVDSLIGNIHANFNTVPEVYIYNGTFNGSTGTDVSLPRVVDSVNEYACKVSATSRAGAIGDIYITKATDKVTIKCSEANTTDTFSVSIYYVNDAFNDGVSVHRKWFVSPSGEAETDHGDSSTDGTIADIIINHISGEQASVELPGRHTYQIRQSLEIPDNVELIFQKGAVINKNISLRNGNYEWYLSGSGSGEYYLQTSGGGNPNITSPGSVIEDGRKMTLGSVGSLVSGEWAWTDNDGLTYATVYACIDGTVDPDGKTADYVEAGYALTINFASGSVSEILPEWWGVDGVSDDIEIQAAITAGSVNKIPVALTKSAYTVSGTIIMPDNAMIYAKNRSIITLANNTNTHLFSVTGDNVTIKDTIADGNKTNQASGCFLKVASPGGSIDGLRVENCEVSDFKEYGIHIEETCANHIYINNKFDGCDKTGILVAPLGTDTSDNIRIEGNHVIDSGSNGIQVYHASTINNTNIFILNNYVFNTTVVPIEIQRAKWGTVSNNIVRTGTNGISVGSCQYVTVTGNVVEEQTAYGIELATFSEGGNAIVTGNEVYNCGTGIVANSVAGQYGYRLVISDNIIDTTTSQEGIEIKAVFEAVISDNVIKDPKTVGIRVNGHGGATDIGDISVTGNVIRFSAALSGGLTGITTLGADRIKISDNLIITSVSGNDEYNSLIGTGGYNSNVYITDNVLIGTVSIVARGVSIGTATDDDIYILKNSIKNFKVGIQTSSNTNPEVTILDNIIEDSTLVDISAHASHKIDKGGAAPTQGVLWFKSDIYWKSNVAAGGTPGWVCVSRVKTEMRVAGAALDTVLEVDATAGMVAGDIIGVEQDNGTWHWTTIANVNDADTVTITVGLVSAAAIDKHVISNLWKAMANLAA